MKELDRLGWVETKVDVSVDALIDLASSIGSIISLPDGRLFSILEPNDGHGAVAGTFSKKYAFSSFPFHTDTAYWARPARYIVMGAMSESSCKTLMLNMRLAVQELGSKAMLAAKMSIFTIKTIEGHKYTSGFIKEGELEGFRFDPNIMSPKNPEANEFHTLISDYIATAEATSISWTGANAVIIDNWNTVHAREKVEEHQLDRRLIRIYVE